MGCGWRAVVQFRGLMLGNFSPSNVYPPSPRDIAAFFGSWLSRLAAGSFEWLGIELILVQV